MARTTVKGERTGREKAAMFIISIGPERSAEVFKHLKEEEIEQLTRDIKHKDSYSGEKKRCWRNLPTLS